MNEQSLAVKDNNQLAAVPDGGISIEQAFIAASTKALDKDSLAIMERLLALDALKRYSEAFAVMQGKIPVIVAESVIPNRGKYQRYEDILQKDGLAKILSDNGFSVSFRQDYTDTLITVTCILRHRAGHAVETPFSVRVGGKSDSDTQADCKASTTAKRNAFCQALNITIRQDVLMDEDNDASLVGNQSEFITPDQVEELSRRVHETNSKIPEFLKYAGAETFAKIPANKYNMLDQALRRREQTGR